MLIELDHVADYADYHINERTYYFKINDKKRIIIDTTLDYLIKTIWLFDDSKEGNSHIIWATHKDPDPEVNIHDIVDSAYRLITGMLIKVSDRFIEME